MSVLEDLRWKKFPVLDDGFVALIDCMGDDEAIAQAARVSFGKGTRKVSDDLGLIRFLMRHRHSTPFEMCLDGETRIPTLPCPGATQKTYTIRQLAGAFERGGRADSWAKLVKVRTVDPDTGLIVPTKIKRAWKTGVQPCYLVHSESPLGCMIVATDNHPFLCPDGLYRPLSELRRGDEVMMNGKGVPHAFASRIIELRQQGKSIGDIADTIGCSATGVYSRLPSHLRGKVARKTGFFNKDPGEYLDPHAIARRTFALDHGCAVCGSPASERHHRDRNPQNNDPANLISLCVICHNAFHHGTTPILVYPSKIRSIEPVGTREVFDLEVDNPNHNFVAEHFVVHNCEIKLLVRVPMDCWRQWIRHRTANVNEYCLAPGTRIWMADQTCKPVEWLCVGDQIVGFAEQPLALRRNRFQVATVTANKRIVRPCKEVVTTHGKVIASDEHLWVARTKRRSCSYRWLPTCELQPGYELAFTAQPWGRRDDYEAGWLAGIFDGEGWFSHTDKSFHVGFAQNSGVVLERAKRILDDYRIPYIEFDQQGGRGNTKTISVSRKYDALRLLSLIRPARLLPKCHAHWMNGGKVTAYPAEVLEVRDDVGEREVCAIGTDTHTLVAEGFLSHNSTRYSEAIDSCQKTPADEWRLQATANRQGSSGLLPPDEGAFLSDSERLFHDHAHSLYRLRLDARVAREQARKDLPLSTYTEAYWKCDLRNVLGFLSLRMDGHAQQEIRSYANVIGEEIVAKLFPGTWRAFRDYTLEALTLSAQDIAAVVSIVKHGADPAATLAGLFPNDREMGESRAKLARLGLIPTRP